MNKIKITYEHYRILSNYLDSTFEISDYKLNLIRLNPDRYDSDSKARRSANGAINQHKNKLLVNKSGPHIAEQFKYVLTNKFRLENLIIHEIPESYILREMISNSSVSDYDLEAYFEEELSFLHKEKYKCIMQIRQYQLDYKDIDSMDDEIKSHVRSIKKYSKYIDECIQILFANNNQSNFVYNSFTDII